MNLKCKKVVAFFSFLFFICCHAVYSQNYSSATNYKTVNTFYDSLMKQHSWIEVDLLLNPIFITQFGSHYRLNGHPMKDIQPTPRFYGVLPSQIAFKDLGETADQANAIYLNFKIPGFENSSSKFLQHTRLMVGLTHDKTETGSADVYYKFPDGGTELTVMADHNITHKLSDLDFKLENLIFSLNWQAGLFASLSNINAYITTPGTRIITEDYTRWIWNNNFYLGGWGFLGAANLEIGGVLCHSYFITQELTDRYGPARFVFNILRHVGITVGARAVGEGLYTSTRVTLNGTPGSNLRVSNYSVFFSGPAINVKYINF